jgi:hypothetical protein
MALALTPHAPLGCDLRGAVPVRVDARETLNSSTQHGLGAPIAIVTIAIIDAIISILAARRMV